MSDEKPTSDDQNAVGPPVSTGSDGLWVWKDNGINLGAWSCPYCDETPRYAMDRTDEKTRIFTCECGKKFKYCWDTCPDGEGGSNLVVALEREVES